MSPSYAPAKKPLSQGLSQNVPRPRKVNPEWHVRAANALPVLIEHRAVCVPTHPSYMHWSEAIGHMHRVLEGVVRTNPEAKQTFLLAQRAVAKACNLTAG